MLSASEASSLTNKDLLEKCEERIREYAEGGARSVVVFGVKDYANKQGIRRVISKLEDEGYEVQHTGANIHIRW